MGCKCCSRESRRYLERYIPSNTRHSWRNVVDWYPTARSPGDQYRCRTSPLLCCAVSPPIQSTAISAINQAIVRGCRAFPVLTTSVTWSATDIWYCRLLLAPLLQLRQRISATGNQCKYASPPRTAAVPIIPHTLQTVGGL